MVEPASLFISTRLPNRARQWGIGLLNEVERKQRIYKCRRASAECAVIALTGAVESFPASADKFLEKLSGVRVSESTIQRVTETAGSRIDQALANDKMFGEPKAWEWHRDAEGRTVAYVSTDATGVKIQGPDGAKAEGQMINVGMIYIRSLWLRGWQ